MSNDDRNDDVAVPADSDRLSTDVSNIPARPNGYRHLTIHIWTTHPDPGPSVQDAARLIAEQLDWGNDEFTSIEATAENGYGNPIYLAGYEMEPGE